MLLKQVRIDLNELLWRHYKTQSPHAQLLEGELIRRGETPVLDHYAIITAPSIYCSMESLAEIFASIGYCLQGRDYLPEKQNDFLWMAEEDAQTNAACDVLPQVVLADFRLHELPESTQTILKKYRHHGNPNAISHIKKLAEQVKKGDAEAATTLTTTLATYLTQRDWPLPSKEDLLKISESNELLAWTLLFGRCPNHFTISVHLLKGFKSLEDFNQFMINDLKLPLNSTGGVIKGSPSIGIEQSSTLGAKITTQTIDELIEIANSFIEFVWRYPKNANQPGTQWHDYFTGFIANNANKVIESLYKDTK